MFKFGGGTKVVGFFFFRRAAPLDKPKKTRQNVTNESENNNFEIDSMHAYFAGLEKRQLNTPGICDEYFWHVFKLSSNEMQLMPSAHEYV